MQSIKQFGLRYLLIFVLVLQGPILSSIDVYAIERQKSTHDSYDQKKLEHILKYAQEHIKIVTRVSETGDLHAEYKATGLNIQLSKQDQLLLALYGLTNLQQAIKQTIEEKNFEAEHDFSNVYIRFTRDGNQCSKLQNKECYIELNGASGLTFSLPKGSNHSSIINWVFPQAYAQNEDTSNSFTQGLIDGLKIDWVDDGINVLISGAIGGLIGFFGGLGPVGWALVGGIAVYTIGSDVITMGEYIYEGNYYKAGEVLGDLFKDVVISVLSGYGGSKGGKALREMLERAALKDNKFAVVARELVKILDSLLSKLGLFKGTNNTNNNSNDSNNNNSNDGNPDSPNNGNGQKPSNNQGRQRQQETDVAVARPRPKAEVPEPALELSDYYVTPDGKLVRIPQTTSAVTVPGGVGGVAGLAITDPSSTVFTNTSPQQSQFALSFNPSQIGLAEATIMNEPQRPIILSKENFGANYMIHLPKGGAISTWQAYKKYELQNGRPGVGGISIPRVELWQKTYTGASPNTPYTDSDPPRTYVFAIEILPGQTPKDLDVSEETYAKQIQNGSKDLVYAMDYFNSRDKTRHWSQDILLEGNRLYVTNNSDESTISRQRSQSTRMITDQQARLIISAQNNWNLMDFLINPIPTMNDIYGIQNQNQWIEIEEEIQKGVANNQNPFGSNENSGPVIEITILFDPIDVRDVLSDLSKEQLQKVREELKRIDEENQRRLRQMVSSGGVVKTDLELLKQLLETGELNDEIYEALKRLAERCSLPVGERDVPEKICRIVRQILQQIEQNFERMRAEENAAYEEIKNKIKNLLADVPWIKDRQDIDKIKEVFYSLDEQSIDNLIQIKEDKGLAIFNEYIIHVFGKFYFGMRDAYKKGQLATNLPPDTNVTEYANNWARKMVELIQVAHNFRRTHFLSQNREMVETINALYNNKDMKRLESDFPDVGAEVEAKLNYLINFIELAEGYNHLADVVIEFYQGARSNRQRKSIENYLRDKYSIEISVDLIQKIRNNLSSVLFSDLSSQEKLELFKALLHAYFENRADAMNDWMPVFTISQQWTLVNDVTFLGQSYKAGDVIDLGDQLGSTDIYFASHDDDFESIEIKFRFGASEQMSSGEVEQNIKELMNAINPDPSQQMEIWIHIHNVAPIPKTFAKKLTKLRMFEHHIRADQAVQFFSSMPLQTVTNVHKTYHWIKYITGFVAQTYDLALDTLKRTLGSVTKLSLDPKKFFRNTSHISLVGSDKYTSDIEGLYYYGQENRVVATQMVNAQAFNDAIQYNMIEEDYGITEQEFVAWLEDMGHDINNLDESQVVADFYYLNAIRLLNGRQYEGVDLRVIYNNMPAKVKAIFTNRGIANYEAWTEMFGDAFHYANIFALFKNWRRAPIMHKHGQVLDFIENSQVYYIELLLNGPGMSQERVGVISSQFLDSGINYIYMNSITSRGEEKSND